MQQNLSGVPETLLIPLWARAAETKEENPIIRDENAVELINKIDYDFSKFDGAWMTQTGVAVRTEILDQRVKAFIRQYPDTVIINIGCGLDTRFFRVDNGTIRWFDLDLPEVISIRSEFFQETQRHKMIGKSVFDYSWIEDIEKQVPYLHKDTQVLFLAEGIFMYFTEQQMTELMDVLTKKFVGAHMLFEMMSAFAAKNSSKHETVKKCPRDFNGVSETVKTWNKSAPGFDFSKSGIIMTFTVKGGNGWDGCP